MNKFEKTPRTPEEERGADSVVARIKEAGTRRRQEELAEIQRDMERRRSEFEAGLRPGERERISNLRKELADAARASKGRATEWSDEQLLEVIREKEGEKK